MLVQHRFDLGGIDIEAGADDQLLGAADDKKDVAVEARQIAGVEPSIPVDGRRSRLGCPIIAAHDIGASDMKLADLAWVDGAAAGLYQERLDAADQRAHGIVAPRADARTPEIPGAHSVMP